MIKVINPDVEIWHQKGFALEDIWEHIARCARVCYQSTPKNKDEDDYHFLVRTLFRGKDILNEELNQDDIIKTHLSVCEHGTVHLKFHGMLSSSFSIFESVFKHNKYSNYCIKGEYIYVTTNMRVLIENNILNIIGHIDKTPNCPYYEKRITASFITDIGISRELNRHRCHSISEESTRYCAYDKDKFGGNITVIKLPWIPYKDDESRNSYEAGMFLDEEILDSEGFLPNRYTKGWSAVDWYIYGLQIANLVYQKTRELGWTAQQAREILPLNTKTQVVHTAFISDWNHWIALRADGASGTPHPCIHEVAVKLKKLINYYVR